MRISAQHSSSEHFRDRFDHSCLPVFSPGGTTRSWNFDQLEIGHSLYPNVSSLDRNFIWTALVLHKKSPLDSQETGSLMRIPAMLYYSIFSLYALAIPLLAVAAPSHLAARADEECCSETIDVRAL